MFSIIAQDNIHRGLPFSYFMMIPRSEIGRPFERLDKGLTSNVNILERILNNFRNGTEGIEKYVPMSTTY